MRGNGNEWRSVESPTDSSLFDVEVVGDEAYAVGSDGLVVAREDGSWSVLVEDGPRENGNSLYGVDVTGDGERAWVAGSSGVVGEYDPAADELVARPVGEYGNAFNDVAVTGSGADANVYVVDGSGYVHYSFENGAAESWGHVRPGSGAELKAVDFHGPRSGFAVDDDGVVYATRDGESWEAVLSETNVTLYGAASRGSESETATGSPGRGSDGDAGSPSADSDVESAVEPVDAAPEAWVSGDGKLCHFRDDEWVVAEVSGGSFNDVYYDGDSAIAVGGGGQVVRVAGDDVSEAETPTGETLNGVSVGARAVAVGASGVVIER